MTSPRQRWTLVLVGVVIIGAIVYCAATVLTHPWVSHYGLAVGGAALVLICDVHQERIDGWMGRPPKQRDRTPSTMGVVFATGLIALVAITHVTALLLQLIL